MTTMAGFDHVTIAREKVRQAERLLAEEGIDCWLMLARETGTGFVCDPSVELLLPGSVIGLSVYGLLANGRHFAVVAGFDEAQTASFGLFDEILSYDESPEDALRNALDGRNPRTIGVNFSESDHGADGITYGQLLWLRRAAGAEHASKLLSAARVAECLRGIKTSSEIAAMRRAIEATHCLFDAFAEQLVVGATESGLHTWMHDELRQRGWASAWDPRWCPGLTVGPDSPIGHTQPANVALEPGNTIAIDFGVRLDGYAADLQRTWYLPCDGQDSVPADLARAFEAVRSTILVGLKELRPGRLGHEVDAVAREHFLSFGYAEFRHGLGHQVGRMAHDGGGVLAPLWPSSRYGAMRPIEAGQVFTLELGVQTPYGLVSLEEMALVTDSGAEIISDPQQTEIWKL